MSTINAFITEHPVFTLLNFVIRKQKEQQRIIKAGFSSRSTYLISLMSNVVRSKKRDKGDFYICQIN